MFRTKLTRKLKFPNLKPKQLTNLSVSCFLFLCFFKRRKRNENDISHSLTLLPLQNLVCSFFFFFYHWPPPFFSLLYHQLFLLQLQNLQPPFPTNFIFLLGYGFWRLFFRVLNFLVLSLSFFFFVFHVPSSQISFPH